MQNEAETYFPESTIVSRMLKLVSAHVQKNHLSKMHFKLYRLFHELGRPLRPDKNLNLLVLLIMDVIQIARRDSSDFGLASSLMVLSIWEFGALHWYDFSRTCTAVR